ncbi:class I SAM-dependent methyltransferase [Desulfovibrio psychrotolerans]|uniref:Methyltransferase domain-containing protein n=1 Tax=Desulfovibrio psychrotolerans TaxID=415242 RepID=A0A7J0C010_9BACT|nr:class I SAM-dependent methyltransferase [Desulfovibrio psychrotolerans]GFM38544.1 hypothetical protein DSM19430T_32280 [Desulfovibrio psychrotolerans]
MIKIAFANDCDQMTWAGYQYVHGVLETLGLPAGDSFWLFSPEDSDMALFRESTARKGTNHDNLLGALKEGRIDTLHGIGAYGRTPLYPAIDDIKRALDYLDSHGIHIRIWSNHGSSNHVHNIAGQGSRTYQQGDLPYSEHYILDAIKDYGVEYFWLSHRLRHTLQEPYRTIVPERTPSGDAIQTFTRYAPSWTTNAWTMHELITRRSLEQAIANEQNVVFFTHWGTRGKENDGATAPLLRRDGMAALALLAEMQTAGQVAVVPLTELLDEEANKPLEQEVRRIGKTCVQTESLDLDNYYKTQFDREKISYFSDVIHALGLTGGTLLDAGGGAGNLCFPASERFTHAVCMDTNQKALDTGIRVAHALQIDNISFVPGSLEDKLFEKELFNVICARGVIHLVEHDRVLVLFNRYAQKNATVLITVNGDGFYQHAIIKKGMNAENYSRLLWNTFHRRVGGTQVLQNYLTSAEDHQNILRTDRAEILDRIMETVPTRMAEVVRAYSPELKQLVGTHCLRHLCLCASQLGLDLSRQQQAAAQAAIMPETNKWSCHYPEEFLETAKHAGYSNCLWRLQSFFGRPEAADPAPDYEEGLLKTWVALLIK